MRNEPPFRTSDGHEVRWLDTGEALLAAELEAIRQAQTSVRFERYIFRASPVAERFRAEFVAAARRGVEVTVMLDYVGCLGLPHGYFADLAAAGGRVVWFNPMRLRFWTFRDHRKMLVVDDEAAFIGGCNVAPEYDGDGVSAGWRDGGIRITGPVVKILADAFESQLLRAGNQIWRARKHGHNGWVHAGGEVSVLLMRPGLHQGILQRALRHDLAGARHLAMTMAYFLPKGRFKRMLLRAARRARTFRLLLPGKTDVPLMQVASRALYSQFQRSGAQVFEYQPQVLHAKVIVIDDIVYVGSANLDPRSLGINFEVMLRIQSAALAERARATFERDLQHSQAMAKLSWRNPVTWWTQFKEKLALLIFTRLDLGVAQLLAQKIERRGSTQGRHAAARGRGRAQEKQDLLRSSVPSRPIGE